MVTNIFKTIAFVVLASTVCVAPFWAFRKGKELYVPTHVPTWGPKCREYHDNMRKTEARLKAEGPREITPIGYLALVTPFIMFSLGIVGAACLALYEIAQCGKSEGARFGPER